MDMLPYHFIVGGGDVLLSSVAAALTRANGVTAKENAINRARSICTSTDEARVYVLLGAYFRA